MILQLLMTREKEYHIAAEGELIKLAKDLLASHPDARIFAFFGAMGVGKTTFIKAICHELGSIDLVSSPTYSIVNHYATKNGQSLYHFDFYRIKSIAEVYDLGYEEYMYSGNYCFIEWPEKLESLLPDEYIRVGMEETNGLRRVVF